LSEEKRCAVDLDGTAARINSTISLTRIPVSYYFGGGVFLTSSQLKSDKTSFPGRLVDADNNVPDAVTIKCWVLPSTFVGPTLKATSPDDQVALSVPAGAPPVWLLTKCHVPIISPHDWPLKLPISAARTVVTAATKIKTATKSKIPIRVLFFMFESPFPRLVFPIDLHTH